MNVNSRIGAGGYVAASRLMQMLCLSLCLLPASVEAQYGYPRRTRSNTARIIAGCVVAGILVILFTIAGIIARRRRLKRMQMHLAGQPQLIPVNPSGGGMFGFGRGGGNMFGGRVFGGPMHPQPHTQQHPHTEQAATYPSPPPMYPHGRNGQGGMKDAQVPPPPYNPEKQQQQLSYMQMPTPATLDRPPNAYTHDPTQTSRLQGVDRSNV